MRYRWLIFIVYMILISWLSLTPAPPEIESDLFGWDKLQHTAAYALFTLLAGWAFGGELGDMTRIRWNPGWCPLIPKRMRRWLSAVAAAVIFGGLLEIAQVSLTQTRTAEWGDLLSDLIGAVCAFGVVMMRDSYWRKK